MSDQTATTNGTKWQSRIVETGEANPLDLLANPKNWRIHPRTQQEVLTHVLDRVGWVQDVIVNRASGFVVDGHLRVSLAISREEPAIPVSFVELTDAEEDLVLAGLDPSSTLAVADPEALTKLLDQDVDQELVGLFSPEDRGLDPEAMSDDAWAPEATQDPESETQDPGAPTDEVPEGDPYGLLCPMCGHEFTVYVDE